MNTMPLINPRKNTWNSFINVVLILILLAHIISANFKYEFLGYCKNPTLNSSDSCNSSQMTPDAPEKLTDEMFSRALCYCDSACLQYGDCCPDLIHLQDVLHQDSGHYNKWKCRMLFVSPFPYVYVIEDCPPNYGVEAIAKRCRKEVLSHEYDYSLDYQVLSKDTNITYANVYCAECHNENITNLHSWEVKFQLQPFSHINPQAERTLIENIHLWKYVPGERKWQFNQYHIAYSIVGKYNEKYNARRCKSAVIQNCPDNWNGTRERLLCASHALHVMSLEDERFYKNKYCAACHNQSTNLTCQRYREAVALSGPFGNKPNIFSYSRLLSFRKKGKKHLCDSLQNHCVDYECGINFDKDQSGQCVPKPSMYHQGGLNDSCPKIHVREEDFVWLNNGSIYINATNQILTPNEYENNSHLEVLICADNKWILWKFSRAQAILSTVCVALSLLCLLVHIIVHLLLSELRNQPGKMLLCLSTSTFTGQLCFEFQGTLKGSIALCQTAAVIMHYSFLSSFFWMNVMAIDVCYTFSRRVSPVKTTTSYKEFLRYSIYGWCSPGVITILSLFNDLFEYLPEIKPDYYNPLGACWINNPLALLVFFVAPLTIVIIENIILFTITVVCIHKTNKIATMARSAPGTDINFNLILIYVKLALIMGVTWIFGFLAMLLETEFLWYLFIICNASQGAFIFMSFTCKVKIFRQLKNLWCKDKQEISEKEATPITSSRVNYSSLK